ncbi:unnamed protein product [Alternaria alternata]
MLLLNAVTTKALLKLWGPKDSGQQILRWPEGDTDQIQITNAGDLLHDIAKGERAYVLHPGGLSCSTISEQVRKLLEDAEKQHTPETPTPQPGPSGDEIRDDDWTKAHLDKCIADAPDLVGLPEEATHRLVATVFNGDPQRAAVPPHKGRLSPMGRRVHKNPTWQTMNQIPKN